MESQLPSWRQHTPRDTEEKASNNDSVSSSINVWPARRLKNIVGLIRREKFNRDAETTKMKRLPR